MKPRIWRSSGEWVCGQYGKHLEWGTGETAREAFRHWWLGQVARAREAVLGRFGGGRFGQ